jgi:membrane protein YdbS with pleckstrin-like domain
MTDRSLHRTKNGSYGLLHGLVRGLFWLIPFVVVALLWVFWFEVKFTNDVPITILLLGVLVLLGHIAWGLIFPRKWLVTIGQREIRVDRGILWATRVFISYDRVQQIDSISTPVMSQLNLRELVVHSAAGGLRIYALDPKDAELIESRVRANQPTVPTLQK